MRLCRAEGNGPDRPLASVHLQLARRFEYFLCVPEHFHLAPLSAQHAVGIDEESAAFDTQIFSAVKALFPDDIEELAELLLLIGQQLERQLLLGLEFLMRRYAVARYTNYLCLSLAKRRMQVAELLALQRAARCHVFRVEIEDEL